MSVSRFRPGRALLLLVMFAAASLAAEPLPPPAPGDWSQAAAQQPAAPDSTKLPPARTVIDRHVKAIGGRDAILSKSSSRVTGTIAVPSAGLTGTFEMFAARPNLTLVRTKLVGVGEMQEGFDGTVAWSISPMTGPALLDGTQLEQRKFDADFYAELQPDGRYVSMTTSEQTEFDGRPCYKLTLVRPGGQEDIHYYDVETGLKAGSVTTRETPMGPLTGTAVQSDYRRFGSLLHPARLTVSAMGLQQVMTITAVEYDTVDPAVFELPVQIKALVK